MSGNQPPAFVINVTAVSGVELAGCIGVGKGQAHLAELAHISVKFRN